MVEKGNLMPNYKKPTRQQGTVPFLWEEEPGIPKKDWKLETISAHGVPPPAKLVTTVPFQWEEKPGTPLPNFSYPQRDSPLLPLPPGKLNCFPPPVYSPCSTPVKIRAKLGNIFSKIRNYDNNDSSEADEEEENGSAPEEEQEDKESEEDDVAEHKEDDVDEEVDIKREQQEEMCELEMKAMEFDESEPVSSAMSLLANCCISTEAISIAMPVEKYVMEEEESDTEYETPTSPGSETDSYFSSCATGRSTLVGSFFECFFPHFSSDSDSGYLDDVHCHDEINSPTLPDQHESNLTVRTPTLGELVRVSGRGYRKRNPSLDFMMNGFRCFSRSRSRANAQGAEQ